MEGTIGMVLSGGGVRGAYEFGALEVLAPVLDEPARIIVGTSAGALGAAYLAANAHEGLEAAARSGAERWLEVDVGDVIGPLCSARELARVLLYGLELLGIRAPAPPSLLDTSPQAETIAALIDFEQLARNVQDGTLVTAAVVATSYATARSVVFHDGGEPPPADDRRGIDYVATRLAVGHVHASSAIQSLFPAVRVGERWYGDGGVRLNTPLAPAVALGTTHVVVVATHPETYAAPPPPRPQSRPPDVVDSMVAVLGSVLADRMVEDLHTLDKINRNVDGGPARLIPRLFVGPNTRHEIGELAAKAYTARHRGPRAVVELDFRLLHALIGACEKGNGDLLSYLFFDEAFISDAIALGIRYARNTLGRGAPWQPAPTAASPAGTSKATSLTTPGSPAP